MVSVPKFPLIPRLSIVIPIGSDLAAFESTLVSVLENQPAGGEIVVAHDGSYDDPFELCDEVQFVTTSSASMVDLISAGVDSARGRFVHVLADGIRATTGWIDYALEKFEHHEVGVVTPIIRSGHTKTIVAAGWSDGRDRLCRPLADGRTEVSPSVAARCGGPYLQASFWRRELIRSLCDAFDGRDCSVQASYAYGQLIETSGWQNVVASDCSLISDTGMLPWETSTFGRGKGLRAIRGHFHHRRDSQSLWSAAQALLSNALRPARYAESFGQAFAPFSAAQIADQLHADRVARCCSDEVILRMRPGNQTRPRLAA